MKITKSVISSLLLFLLTLPLFPVKKTVSYYEAMYHTAKSIQEKRDLMKELNSEVNDSYISFLTKVIDEQLNYGIEKNKNLLKDYEEWLSYTALAAGKIKLTDCSQKLKQIYSYARSPVCKGLILRSIGMMEAQDQLPWLNQLLKEFNLLHKEGKGGIRFQESTVYELIQALRVFKDPSSFEPAFYAAMPNYSEKIRKEANKLLLEITQNPASLAENIINKDLDFMLVHQMMTYVYHSNSPNEDKEKIIIQAINRCLTNLTAEDPVTSSYREKIKLNGVEFLGSLKAASEEAVQTIDKKWDADNQSKQMKEDTAQKLANVEALQKIATPQAVEILLKNLKFYYTKGKEGFGTGYGTKEGAKIFTAIIRALGETAQGNNNVYIELQRIKIAKEFAAPLQKEAEKALSKL